MTDTGQETDHCREESVRLGQHRQRAAAPQQVEFRPGDQVGKLTLQIGRNLAVVGPGEDQGRQGQGGRVW